MKHRNRDLGIPMTLREDIATQGGIVENVWILYCSVSLIRNLEGDMVYDSPQLRD